MQPENMWRHGLALGLAFSFVETALESKLRNTFFGLHDGRHFEEAVRFTDVLFAGAITAADHNPLGGFLHNLEVVGDQGADIVVGGLQFRPFPEVVRGLGTLVFPGEVGALEGIS